MLRQRLIAQQRIMYRPALLGSFNRLNLRLGEIVRRQRVNILLGELSLHFTRGVQGIMPGQILCPAIV